MMFIRRVYVKGYNWKSNKIDEYLNKFQENEALQLTENFSNNVMIDTNEAASLLNYYNLLGKYF